jgi:hypothetical protein
VSVLLSTRTFRKAGKFRLKPQAKAGQSGPPFNRVRLVHLGRWIVVGVDIMVWVKESSLPKPEQTPSILTVRVDMDELEEDRRL